MSQPELWVGSDRKEVQKLAERNKPSFSDFMVFSTGNDRFSGHRFSGPIVRKNDRFIGKLVSFINWIRGHDRFRGQKGPDHFFPLNRSLYLPLALKGSMQTWTKVERPARRFGKLSTTKFALSFLRGIRHRRWTYLGSTATLQI